MRSKSTIFATPAVLAVMSLAGGCGKSPAEQAQELRLLDDAIARGRSEALNDLRSARDKAKLNGRKFAMDGAFTKREQCESALANERLWSMPQAKEFGDEMKKPFLVGCMLGANRNVHDQKLAAAARKADEKARLAANRKGNKK